MFKFILCSFEDRGICGTQEVGLGERCPHALPHQAAEQINYPSIVWPPSTVICCFVFVQHCFVTSSGNDFCCVTTFAFNLSHRYKIPNKRVHRTSQKTLLCRVYNATSTSGTEINGRKTRLTSLGSRHIRDHQALLSS